ncbi:AraC family transcriptional regulator [Paenibacillus sp. S28]|uniref:AraC family transcriptional regulator n=1 Tax=Paenibacillus sp. S28 TaxID=2767463 RepID=UPI00190BF9E9|nr:AraC family transcriptional regulator [Paenibacillus sp. S28]MBJ9992329.1 AraC family transcriptional regulator [Paenibacillus sp. S28]
MIEYGHEYAEYLYHTPSEFEKSGGVWAIRAGRNKAKPNYQVGPRVIECYSVHVVLGGGVTLAFGGRTVRLRSGDLFCLFPGLRYSYQLAESDDPLRMYWLAFQGNQAEMLVERIGFNREKPYVTDRWLPEHERTMLSIHDLLRDKSDYDEALLQLMLYQLFVALSLQADELSKTVKTSGWLERSIQYMNTHYTENIAVADVAKVAGVHRSYLYQECSRLLGCSPMQYIIRLRMEKGRELLMNTRFSVTDIALSVGYPDLFSFSRAFSKYYGMSPTQYQAQPTKGLRNYSH